MQWKKKKKRLDVKNLTSLNELREEEKKTLGSCKDSKRVMAGGRCASSSCQSRGRTTEGGDGEKLSSVHLNTPLSAKKEWCVLADVCIWVSTSSLAACCAGRYKSRCQAPWLVHASDREGGISPALAPGGTLLVGRRQPASRACWLNLWMRRRKGVAAG